MIGGEKMIKKEFACKEIKEIEEMLKSDDFMRAIFKIESLLTRKNPIFVNLDVLKAQRLRRKAIIFFGEQLDLIKTAFFKTKYATDRFNILFLLVEFMPQVQDIEIRQFTDLYLILFYTIRYISSFEGTEEKDKLANLVLKAFGKYDAKEMEIYNKEMNDNIKIMIYSFIGILLSLSLISAIWLGMENRKLYSQYVKEKSLWYERNRELEFKLDKFSSELEDVKKKLQDSNTYIARLEEERNEAEAKLKTLADENKRLREKVARLVKEKEQLERKIGDFKHGGDNETENVFLSNVLREKANLELRLNSLQRLLERKDAQISQLDQKKESLNQTLNEILDKKMELGSKLEETKKLIASLSQSLEQEKKEKLVYLDKMRKLEGEKSSLKLQIEEAKREKKGMEEKISALEAEIKEREEEKEKFAKQLGYINQVLEDKMLKVANLKQDLEMALERIKRFNYTTQGNPVELPRIEVKAGLRGEVINVNLDKGFVVIDLGKRDGVKVGMKFNVYRGGKLIGKLEIIDVREVTSAAKILVGLPESKISEKDIVLGQGSNF